MNIAKSLLVLGCLTPMIASADLYKKLPIGTTYEVTVTNITKGVSFTPILGTTHSDSVALFSIGEPATTELYTIAEAGDVGPQLAVLDASSEVLDTSVTDGLLEPGMSVTFEIEGNKFYSFSMAAMLLPTNDTFVALDAVELPFFGSVTYLANAYDAGSETNDEVCASIPGPTCGGEALSPNDLGEGYVYPSPAFHGEADISLSTFNWQGPVAKVTITRVF